MESNDEEAASSNNYVGKVFLELVSCMLSFINVENYAGLEKISLLKH